MDDNDIIRLYWARNGQAIRATSEKYGNYCKAIARNILNNEEDAEECVNDTYLNAWNSMPPHWPEQLSTFLGKITRRVWGTMAACIAVIAVLGVGIVQSGLFGNKSDIATLDSGEKIVFAKLKTAGSSIDIAGAITTRQLTEEELAAMFPGLPVTAHAVFTAGDGGTGHSQKLIGFEGNIGAVKMVVATSDIPLLDTVLVGQEGSSEINGTNITAGYFVTAPNSQSGQNAIYYAAFELGSCKMYLENSGAKENSEAIKNQLAEVIQTLIENGEPDLTSLSSIPRP